MTETPLLEVRAVSKRYRERASAALRPAFVTAVDSVSFSVARGEIFGIVGESGCGKSTLARLIMGLEEPDEGRVFLAGQRIDHLPERQRRRLRGRFQMVFQDSGASLNPRRSVSGILSAPLRCHHPEENTASRVSELLDMVGLPASMRDRYPHELSGGQRQRVCIARALATRPELMVLDEPVSALDVSVQAQILNLLRGLQRQLGLTCVLIGHGLGAMRYISDRIGVMYLGQIVEEGDADEVLLRPLHPYTRALAEAAPSIHGPIRRKTELRGEVSLLPPEGACALYERCAYRTGECLRFARTMLSSPDDPAHLAQCLKAKE